MRSLFLAMCVASCGNAQPPVASATPKPVAPVASVATTAELPLHWVGEWTSVTEQVTFTIDIRFAPVANGAVNGRILWTLMSAPPEHFLASRIGDSGTEHVVGEWSPADGKLRLKGTSVDSPGFLVVDEYKLHVSNDRNAMYGHSRGSKDDWNNNLSAKRSD